MSVTLVATKVLKPLCSNSSRIGQKVTVSGVSGRCLVHIRGKFFWTLQNSCIQEMKMGLVVRIQDRRKIASRRKILKDRRKNRKKSNKFSLNLACQGCILVLCWVSNILDFHIITHWNCFVMNSWGIGTWEKCLRTTSRKQGPEGGRNLRPE